MNPLVSILVATYNAELFLAEAIESVQASAYTNWELIIVDDKSLDNSLQIAKDYQRGDSRIKVYSNEINLGDYPNRNKAASYAQGKYLKYLDNDDVLYKYSLNYMVDAMERFPDAALGLSFSLVDDEKPYPIFSNIEQTFKSEFLGKGFLSYGPSASIILREAFEKSGGFSTLPFVGDQELWLRLALKAPVVKLQPSLIWYRVHDAQESLRERKTIVNQYIRFNILLDALNSAEPFLSEIEMENALKKLKRNHARFILRNILLKRKIKEGFVLWQKSNLSIKELFDGLKPYLK